MRDELVRAELEHPTVSAVVTPVVLGPDEVHFRAGPWTGPRLTITDEDGDGILADLIRSLDGTRSVDDLLAAFEGHEAAVLGLLRKLHEKNVVVPARDRAEDQVGLDVVRERLSPGEFRDRVGASEAAVIADGATGATVAGNLLDAGVGGLEVVAVGDADEIDVRADDRLRRSDDPAAAIERADVAVACSDAGDTPTLLGLNERALDRDGTVVFAQVAGYDGVVGPTVVPGETACYECFDERVVQSRADDGAKYEGFKDGVAHRRGADVASPFAQVVAGFATLEVLHLLADERPVLVDKVATVDFLNFAFEPNPVLKVPNCDACGAHSSASVGWERFADVVQFGDRAGEF